ncbi:MAG TPA: neutral/alkaline non-lysosomal ceramidase N-terminal domain-containing protein [Bryobacteraceae bacterium]|nr:neutral/alkaline non-lysosomal ceramidase N-terminal domain-containing protein [Bryobacteraceae bacterium]
MFKAGFGKRPISPAIGAPLAGFAARKGTCEGVHDELFARALVLENDSTAIALVSLDVLAVASDFVEKIRRAIAVRVPIEPAAILISSTHTHAGPVTVSTFFNPDESLDPNYMALLGDAIVAAVEAAWQTRFAARIGVGTGIIEGLGVNRRSKDGKPVDPEIGIVKVDDAHEKTRAVLMNYGCHPTVLGPDNLLASGDFPNPAIERVEGQLGPGNFAMYVNGAQGDISVGHSSELSAIGVITPGRTFERAAELGQRLGDAVLQALPGIATTTSAYLRFETLTAGLPIKPYPDAKQTENALREAERKVQTLCANGNSAEYRQAQSELLYASITHYYARETKKYANGVLPIELQAIQIDDNVFMAVPAEVFVEIGLRIKKASPLRTFVAGVTNGYIGYLPSRKAYEAGGYEVVSAKCDANGEDRLFEGVMRLQQSLVRQHA